MRKPICTLGVLALMGVAQPLFAEYDPEKPYPIPADAGKMDLTGVWYHSSSNHTVEGSCPLGPEITGTMIVEGGDGKFTIQMTGAECRPPEVCLFDGEIYDGGFGASNAVVVDDEGGKVNSGFYITFFQKDGGTGWYRAIYTLNDFKCSWRHDFTVQREKP